MPVKASLKQTGFGGGIISPQALGRTDQQKYAVGARALLNAWVTRFGTVENRPGSGYCGSVKDPTTTVRLVPFISFTGQSYILEFGNADFGAVFGVASYMRPWKNGAQIPLGSVPAFSGGATYAVGSLVAYLGVTYYCVTPNTGVTPGGNALWCPVSSTIVEIPLVAQGWSSAQTYQIGQWVLWTPGTTAYYATAASTNVTPPNAGSWSVLTGYGTGLIPVSLRATFQYVQQNDILTIAAQGMTPLQILHFSDTNWTYQQVSISNAAVPINVSAIAGAPSSSIAAPTGLAVSGGQLLAGTSDFYQVAAFNASVQSAATAGVGNSNFFATPGARILVSWNPVVGATGYAVYKQHSPGSAAVGLAVITAATSWQDFGSQEVEAVAVAPSAPTGTTIFTYVVTAVDAVTGAESPASLKATCTGGTPSSGSPNTISWTAPTSGTPAKYNVYSIVGGVPGYIGTTANLQFKDTNFLPDTSKQPPINTQTLLATINDTPAVVAYYQQRLCFANTANQPSSVWCSNIGAYTTFSVGVPAADSQYVAFTLAGTQVQPIQAMVDLGQLIVHTTNAEYTVTGNAFGAITPSAVVVKNTGSAGSSLIQPVVIGNTDLFVQQGATRLNDLRYEVQRFTFAGKDLTKFATDLFRGRTIVATSYQKLPHSIVWCVLDNGAMVGLTYVSEDELYAWHLHSTANGWFEQVATVVEGSAWALYAVVRRTINGATVRYLERFAARDCLDSVLFTDSVFADASVTYDGRNTNGSATCTVTTAAGWTPTDLLTITIPTGPFSAGDAGVNQIVLQQIDAATGLVTDRVAIDILTYVSATVVRGRSQRTVPTWARVALTTWGKAVRAFSGIGHLEGQSLTVLADGSVVADPLAVVVLPNGTTAPAFPAIVVTGGAFALTAPAMVVTAGLPMQTDVETLPIENAQGETFANKRVQVRECTPVFYASRGGSFGQDAQHLRPIKQADPAANGFPQPGITGPVRVPIQGTSQTTGQVHIRHTEPTPFALSAIVVTAEVGD